MDTEALPSYEYVDPPIYTPRANTTSSPRAVPSTQSGQEYRYNGDILALCLGPKRSGIIRPTYGWNDDIAGYVLIKRNVKKVKCIKVHIEGTLVIGNSDGGFLLLNQKRVSVLKLSQTLLEVSEAEQGVTCAGGLIYPFTFPLPSYVTGGTEPLPPTSFVLNTGMTASVTYFVKVEMIRNGKLRANERLGTFFNYLPRTFAPSPVQFRNSFSNNEEYEEPGSVLPVTQWQAFALQPRKIRSDLLPCNLQVSLHLQNPLIYASTTSFPFRVEIVSPDNDPLLFLFSDLAIDLIRMSTVSMENHRTVRETVVGRGGTQRIEETPSQKIIHGEVTCSDQGESSWHVDHIDVKHLLRIKLSPRSLLLPIFSHSVYVGMRTHLQDEDDTHEARLPALSRLPQQFQGVTP